MRPRRSCRRGWAVGLVVMACVQGSPWPADLEAVDHPDLAAVEDTARRQLAAGRATLDELLGRGRGEPAELAGAFGDMGRLYHAYRLLAPAAACYRNAERLDPQSFLWPYYLGLAAEAAGRYPSARAHFERALALGPHNGPVRLRLGEVLLAMNDPEGARAFFEPLSEDTRYAAAAHRGLGRAAASSGRHEEAVRHFEKAIELQPMASDVRYALGTALRRLGRLDEARRHLEDPGSDNVDFPDPLAELLEELAESSGSHLRRANRALMNGRLEEAVSAYQKAVEADPSSVAARRNLALALVRQGRMGEAAEQIEAALEIAPNDAALYLDLGNARRAQRDAEPAIAAYRKAVDIAPGFVRAHFNLANALGEQNRWDEASAHLDEVLNHKPNDGRARYLAAMGLHHRGRTEEGVARLEALLADEPGNVAARQGLAGLYAAQGRPQRALAIYREVLELDLPTAEKGRLLDQAAQLAWRQGRRRQAVRFYRAAVELVPDSSAAYTRLANVLQLMGERREATDLFVRAVELDPKNATAWLSEASLRILAGDYARAVDRLEAALEAVGAEPGLDHALARLLATCPEPELRDGARALMLARRAYGARRSPEHAATVAMALAEAGRFEEAIRWQRSLVQQASAGQVPPAMRQQLAAHLELYEAGRAVRIDAAREP